MGIDDPRIFGIDADAFPEVFERGRLRQAHDGVLGDVGCADLEPDEGPPWTRCLR
jgi:hypothetical protein